MLGCVAWPLPCPSPPPCSFACGNMVLRVWAVAWQLLRGGNHPSMLCCMADCAAASAYERHQGPALVTAVAAAPREGLLSRVVCWRGQKATGLAYSNRHGALVGCAWQLRPHLWQLPRRLGPVMCLAASAGQ
jgi:hypothetical protein